jgi:signal transduction histidine kinase/ActR/RegA family two-component response regulator
MVPITRLRRLVAPPAFEDAEQAQRAQIFHRVMLTTMRVASPVLLLIPVVQHQLWSRALFAFLVVNSLGLTLLEVNRRGRTAFASKLLVGGLITLVTLLGLTAGGVRSPGVTMYFLFVLMAGLLLGQRAGIRVAFICASLSLSLVVIEMAGWLPAPRAEYKPETFWLLNCLYLGMVLALLRIATDALARGLERVQAELRERRAAEREREEAERRRRESESQLRQSQKMEALGTLAGGMAHDFNNILAAIMGNSELALVDLEPGHRARTSILEIERASARAADIVKRILLFSRRQEADHRVVALRPIVEEAIKLMRFSLPKDIYVRTAFGPELPSVAGDASQLSQVIMNLATNAAHAMKARGGELSVEVDVVDVTAPEAATAGDLRVGRYVRVLVRDTGTGMSRETMERIFEPFFTTREHEGTGLGLSVVHGIVQDHHGAIRVDSEPGKGTSVRVYLPVVAAEPGQRAGAATTDHRGRGERIMYVDDEEMLIGVMKRSLQQLGYRCVGYADPAVALGDFRLDPKAWAAVITDLSMPPMSGLDLAREMRVLRPDLRVALVSGYADDPSRVLQAGISTRIQKPYSIDTLGAALYELLNRPAMGVQGE